MGNSAWDIEVKSFIEFLGLFLKEYLEKGDSWENPTLESFFRSNGCLLH
jgi:hypothetical protein